MKDLNSCTFIGRLTKDADLRVTNTGIDVANFSIAVNSSEKAEAGTFRLAFQKNPPSVFIARPEDVPPEYWRIIPETREPDKRKMLDDLKAGREIPGALLAQGTSLRIR